jgi:uncharacterized protein (TIGR00288 family)
MNNQQRVMLLIDADNVTADVIEQAYQRVMQEHGAIHVRRAYCTAELAAKHLKLFKALSIRPMVNVSTGKNSTDIALAVDALDLVLAERPELVVLVSSDSDFAPLVIRLREKGCRVEGIGQEGKTGDDSKAVYDAFVDLPHRKTRAPAKRVAASAKAATGPAAPPVAAPAPTRPRAAVALPDDVRRILAALPELLNGDKLQLNQAKDKLLDAGLLSKNAPSTKLFKNYPAMFVLTPERQPNKVHYIGPRQH